MKVNIKRHQKIEENQCLIRTTVKQFLLALALSERFGKSRLERVLATWCEVVEECNKEKDSMLYVDERLKELGVPYFDKEKFEIKKEN